MFMSEKKLPAIASTLASLLGLIAVTFSLAAPRPALARALPEDMLKGVMIISDSSLPTKWTSPAAYASQLKKLSKSSLNYDKKTGKLQIYYAAFFADPVNDIQVNFVIYDITNGVASKAKKGAWEAFLGRKGERVLFNSVELDKEDVEMNKKYLFAIETKGKIIAKSEVKLLGEAPKYSGKVEFTEEETKKPKE
jgi:hypothetical protein